MDFGRSVDLHLLGEMRGSKPMDIKLRGEAATDEMQCAAMKDSQAWSFDADTFGVVASAHIMLFGDHMEIQKRGTKWLPRETAKRYHQRAIWDKLFLQLLNKDDLTRTALGSTPRSLRDLRMTIENYLQSKQHDLQAALLHQATLLPSSRPMS